ncbi:MAG: PAS domain-containing protein [Lentisphaeria bacterium]|nr:PAS domain-containing protein [Lentisphaeria bacterium]
MFRVCHTGCRHLVSGSRRLLWALVWAAIAAGAAQPRVLLVNSYGPEVRWAMEITAGVREGLTEHFPGVTVLVDHIEADPMALEEASGRLASRIAAGHRAEAYDVAIAADDAAFQFVLSRHEVLLPGVPVVFCGVSDFGPGQLRGQRLVTGVLQLPDLRLPLVTAVARQKAFRHLVVVHDGTPAGLEYRRIFGDLEEELLAIKPDIRFVYLSGEALSTAEMIESVRLLPPDCLLLLTVWYCGKDGEFVPRSELISRVARTSPVPVYSASELAVGHDLSRERLLEAYRLGKAAASLTVRILRGIPPSEIPVEVLTPVVDEGHVLGGMESSRRVAPAPPSAGGGLFAGRSGLVAAFAAALVCQCLLIAMLFRVMGSRRRTQAALEQSRNRLEVVLDSVGVGLVEWDLRTNTIAVSEHCSAMLGYAPGDLPTQADAWGDMIHAEDREAVTAALSKYLDDGSTSFRRRCRIRGKGGDYHTVDMRGETVDRDADGTPIRLVSVLLSVTPPEMWDASGASHGGPGCDPWARGGEVPPEGSG